MQLPFLQDIVMNMHIDYFVAQSTEQAAVQRALPMADTAGLNNTSRRTRSFKSASGDSSATRASSAASTSLDSRGAAGTGTKFKVHGVHSLSS